MRLIVLLLGFLVVPDLASAIEFKPHPSPQITASQWTAYYDEVKAAHGATVGQLDERALFYLRSRGLPLDLARRMLVSAFCSAVLSDLEPVALRARIDAMLAARLPQAEDEA